MRVLAWTPLLWLALLGAAHAQTSAAAPEPYPGYAEQAAPPAPTGPGTPDPSTQWMLRAPRDLADVVPLPPPKPARYPSIEAYEADLQARISSLRLRELQLESLRRPPSRRRRIALGFAGGGVGLGVFFFSEMGLVYGSDNGLSRSERIGFGSGMAVSAIGAIAGFSIAIWTLTRRPYRAELRETRREREAEEGALWRVRSERGVTFQTSGLSARLQARF